MKDENSNELGWAYQNTKFNENFSQKQESLFFENDAKWNLKKQQS